MSPRVVRRLPTAEMLAQDVADSLVRRIEKLQSDGRIVELCLTGGRVANLAYEHLARVVGRSKVDPGALELWWTRRSSPRTIHAATHSRLCPASRARSRCPLHVPTRCRRRMPQRILRRQR